MFPLIPSPYVSQPLCSPVSMFPGPYVTQSLCSPALLLLMLLCLQIRIFLWMFTKSLMFTVPIFPKCFFPPAVPMFPKDVPLSLCSPSLNSTAMTPLFHRSAFHSLFPPKHVSQSLCSPEMPRCSYAPRSLSGVPKNIGTGSMGTGGHLDCDYRDWGTSGLGNIFGEHGEWKHFSRAYRDWGTQGLGEYMDWGAKGRGGYLWGT